MKRIYIFIASVISLIAMSVPSKAYEPTVREDRVWECATDYYDWSTGTAHSSLSKIRFRGTEQINGITYHRWVKTEEILWQSKAGVIISMPDTSYTEKTIALLREDGGKIWICLSQEQDSLYQDDTDGAYRIITSSENIDLKDVTEKVLYDFTLNVGDSVTLLVEYFPEAKSGRYEAGGYLHEYKDQVEETEFREINNKTLRQLKYSRCGIEAIESIGAYSLYSTLARPGVQFMIDGGYGQNAFLNGIYDGAGNRIFGKWEYSVPANAGISDVIAPVNLDRKMYDLMGREIKEPAPGTVYIQGGRKLIAR